MEKKQKQQSIRQKATAKPSWGNIGVFRVRCSSIGQVMPSAREKGNVLSRSAQTYCDRWIKEQLYRKDYSFASPYTEKGNVVEDCSIEFVSGQLGLGRLMKNARLFEDAYKTGTPDILPPARDLVIDIKNSWDWTTFPLLDEKIPARDSYWQLQGYMDLAGCENAKLVYVLTDTPLHLIEGEALKYHSRYGHGKLYADAFNMFRDRMTYPGVPAGLRIKVFDIERNDTDVERIHERVMQCRNYIDGVLKRLGM